MKTSVLFFAMALLVAASPAASAQADRNQLSPGGVERITKEVRHELMLLPYYGVFDFLAYKVDANGNVTLMGQVTRPTLKSDAENVTKKVEGVEHVDNQIKVLPLSSMDDQIRRAAFRAIYGSPQLTKYSWQSVQSIHIIVDGGHITLEGTVDNEADKNVAEIQAKSVPGAFSVNNDLKVVPE
jgi:osmotically-inducible protein OsmY